ncbi:MAG: cytochrome c maturation protein CcmE [Candidatus Schekmanbacteria bacterium]|nr:cytochrome c maturation protein CcmE [Candidatus Schekmanbacteria bacterium]
MVKKKKIKFIAGGIIISLAIGYMVYAGVRDSMVYYMTPVEILAKGTSVYGQGIRISGKIKDGSINWNARDLELSFILMDSQETIPVHYKGVVPDTFKYGVEVIVEGKLVDRNLFEATTLLSKCPSKYDAKEG